MIFLASKNVPCDHANLKELKIYLNLIPLIRNIYELTYVSSFLFIQVFLYLIP